MSDAARSDVRCPNPEPHEPHRYAIRAGGITVAGGLCDPAQWPDGEPIPVTCGARIETVLGGSYECRLAPHSRDERHRDDNTAWMTAPNETRPERIGRTIPSGASGRTSQGPQR